MARPDGLLEVGRIGRAHGVNGDVFLVLSTDRVERAAVGSKLWVVDRWLTVSQSSSSNGRWRIHLDGVDDRTDAESLAGTTVFAEPLDDPAALWVHQLIGSAVVEIDGTTRGRCVSVIANPAADLLELDSGALVPVNFVCSLDAAGDETILTIDPPDGLFDLNG